METTGDGSGMNFHTEFRLIMRRRRRIQGSAHSAIIASIRDRTYPLNLESIHVMLANLPADLNFESGLIDAIPGP